MLLIHGTPELVRPDVGHVAHTQGTVDTNALHTRHALAAQPADFARLLHRGTLHAMADVLAAHAICHVYHGTEIVVVVVNVLFHGAKLQQNRRTDNKNNVKKTKKRPQTNKGGETNPGLYS